MGCKAVPVSRFIFAFLLLLGIPAASRSAPASQPRPMLVFAAASLTDALREIGAGYEQSTHASLKTSFDASSTLARQIEAGAQADVFFSADTDWMDYLEKRDLIQPATRTNVVGNRLVLIAPAASRIQLRIEPHFRLAEALGQGRLATGDPDSVPAGRYAHAALATLGVWDAVAPHLARAENARIALRYVARGEAPLGIVYASDARIDGEVRVVDTFPADTHPPIVYPVALTRGAQHSAGAFLAYLLGPESRAVFVKYGFTPLAR